MVYHQRTLICYCLQTNQDFFLRIPLAQSPRHHPPPA